MRPALITTEDLLNACWLVTTEIAKTKANLPLPFTNGIVLRLEEHRDALVRAHEASRAGVPVDQLPILAESLGYVRGLADRTEDPDGWRQRFDASIVAVTEGLRKNIEEAKETPQLAITF